MAILIGLQINAGFPVSLYCWGELLGLCGCMRLWAMSVVLLGVTNAVLGLVGLAA